jgi:hypothetical protein
MISGGSDHHADADERSEAENRPSPNERRQRAKPKKASD